MGKLSKAQRAAIRYENEQRGIEANLPLPIPEMRLLLDWVWNKAKDEGCDHTFRHTLAFLDQRGLPDDAVIPWLIDAGGYCDCGVAENVVEQWFWKIGEAP